MKIQKDDEFDQKMKDLMSDDELAGKKGKNWRRLSGLAERRKLDYLINALRYAGKIFDDSLLEMSMHYLTMVEKRRIINCVIEKTKLRKVDCKDLIFRFKQGWESLDSTMTDMYRNDLLKNDIFRGVFRCLFKLQATRPESTKKCLLQKKLDEIASVFSLNPAEKEILLLLQLVNTGNSVDRLFSETATITDTKSRCTGSLKGKRTIMVLTGLSKQDVDLAASEKSPLVRAALLNNDGEPAAEVIDFLEGNNAKPFSRRYFNEFNGEVVPLEVHTVDKEHIETIKKIWGHKPGGKGINILLYGEPGTGKTEFARSLGRFFKLPVYEVSNLAEEKSDRNDLNMFRYRAFMACQKMVDTEKSVVIVDEADTLLNSVQSFFSFTPVAEKGQINKLLDESSSFAIWITNRFHGIDDSTKRRFDYSIGFEKMTFTQRRAVWQHALIKHKLAGCISAAEIDMLATDYEISAGGIDVALRNASRVYAGAESKKGVMEIVRSVMKAHLKILDADKNSAQAKKANAPEYSLDGLNIKGDITETVSIISKFNDYWIAADENAEIRNMNILLYGPPGTGKTEFAKYVARLVNRRLIVKRSSDLVSCYIGETEKNMARAFSEAERDKAILFIDEADSLLGSREGAVRSWEISEVNEMLTNMESFRGMLICATNFKQIVDSAAIRRFNIKLEFDYLNPEGNVIFYELFLNKLYSAPLSAEDAVRLKSLSNLTPGDFKVVFQKYSFFDRKELTHAMFIDALGQELMAKNAKYGKIMGFKQA